jgi:hypothetical protein
MLHWSCGYYILFFAPCVAAFCLHEPWRAGHLRTGSRWVGLVAAGGASLALTLPGLLPYLDVRFDRRLPARARRDSELLGQSVGAGHQQSGAHGVGVGHAGHAAVPEGEGFLGVTVTLLAVVGSVHALWTARGRQPVCEPRWRTGLGWVALAWVVVNAALLCSHARTGPRGLHGGSVSREGLEQRSAAAADSDRRSGGGRGTLAPHPLRRGTRGPHAARFGALLLSLFCVWMAMGPRPMSGVLRLNDMGLYQGSSMTMCPASTAFVVPARYVMVAGLFRSIVGGVGA